MVRKYYDERKQGVKNEMGAKFTMIEKWCEKIMMRENRESKMKWEQNIQ